MNYKYALLFMSMGCGLLNGEARGTIILNDFTEPIVYSYSVVDNAGIVETHTERLEPGREVALKGMMHRDKVDFSFRRERDKKWKTETLRDIKPKYIIKRTSDGFLRLMPE